MDDINQKYHWEIQGLYGGEWSTETVCESGDDALEQIQSYSVNCPDTYFRIIKRK